MSTKPPYDVGPATDRLVNEFVLGRGRTQNPLPFSSVIGAAWTVVEALVESGYDVAFFTTASAVRDRGRWTCAIASGELGAKATAETPALAICRAALALVQDR